MSRTLSLRITLPDEMAEMVRQKVASGEYASESEVVRDGLRALKSRDAALGIWLREQIVPAYAAHMADPTRARSAEEAFDEAEARYDAKKAQANG